MNCTIDNRQELQSSDQLTYSSQNVSPKRFIYVYYRPWTNVYNLSPCYIWRNIISMANISEGMHLFKGWSLIWIIKGYMIYIGNLNKWMDIIIDISEGILYPWYKLSEGILYQVSYVIVDASVLRHLQCLCTSSAVPLYVIVGVFLRHPHNM